MAFPKSNIDVDDILSKLTLEEKVGLLAAKDWWRTAVINREGVFVPHIKTTDGPNGARGESYVSGIRAACFPCSSNLGATFDTELLYKVGKSIAAEAISKSAHVLLAPTLNVIRSPLGGRNYETYSEDPTVLGLLSAAFVNGCQSMGIAATPKHFVGNEAENKRTVLTAQIDEQTLREIYLYGFQLVMKHSNPLCFMTSYNRVNNKYVAEDPRLIDDILRKEWGFKGLIMSDWSGTYSTAEGVNAGNDLEMPGPTIWRGQKLLDAVKLNEVSEKTIDRSAKRILELARILGRFDNPTEDPETEVNDPSRDAFIRDAASEGMVMLKNENNILPIPDGKTVALIGYLAKIPSLGGGGSAKVNSLHAVTPLEGFKELNIEHTFAAGVPVFGALPHASPDIVSMTGGNGSETKPVRLQWFNGPEIGKNLVHEEYLLQAEYMIKEAWPRYLAKDYCTQLEFDVTPKTTGDHILSIITTGISLVYIDGVKVYDRQQETVLEKESFYFFKKQLERRFTHRMNSGQRYTLMVQSWATDPKLLYSSPLNGRMFQGASLRFFEYVDIPKAVEDAAAEARKHDYAVVCVGTTNEIESEGYDRDTMDLPGEQLELIRAVARSNPKTVVVNFSGSPVTMSDFVDRVPAIVQAWFPGQECGHSIARILTGQINPSGRLPFSWPRRLEDNPSYGNFPVNENNILSYEEGLDVGYRYYDRKHTPEPLFPFGYGLSYATFEISDPKISAPKVLSGLSDSLEVSCQVENTGKRHGKLVVQFYVQYPETTLVRRRPLKELKGFHKVALDAGQMGLAKVSLDKYAVSFYDAERGCWRALSGRYIVHIGVSTSDIKAQISFDVPEGFMWSGI